MGDQTAVIQATTAAELKVKVDLIIADSKEIIQVLACHMKTEYLVIFKDA